MLLLGIFNELNEHLRIGVTLEGKALLSELIAQEGEVLDDAVVHNDQVARL